MAWPEPTVSDLPYLVFGVGAVVAVSAAGTLQLAALPAGIAVVDWVEYRSRLSAETPLAGVATAVVLCCLLVCCTLTQMRFGLYFALIGGAFFAQAVRFVFLRQPAPSTLFRQGYPNLVALSILCSALADGLPQFRWVTLWLLAGAYCFRKLYVRW
jgi:hypothetical protein